MQGLSICNSVMASGFGNQWWHILPLVRADVGSLGTAWGQAWHSWTLSALTGAFFGAGPRWAFGAFDLLGRSLLCSAWKFQMSGATA